MSLADPTSGLVDYAASLDCIHCGLCLNTCPTYRESGQEAWSPRGRVHLMRALAEERIERDAALEEALDSCLICRRCESVCPAGVRFGAMLEHTRDALEPLRRRGPLARLARWIGLRRLLPSRRALHLTAGALALAQRLKLTSLAARLGGPSSLAWLPPVPARRERRPLPAQTEARGERRGAVAVLAGCVMPELFGRVGRATLQVLSATGVDVHVPPRPTCCGALHAHNGDLETARELARATIAAFEPLEGPVVVNSAGCGAHLRELDRLLADDPAWAERAGAFSERVIDLSAYLAQPEVLERLRPALGPLAESDLPLVIAWDDPCHLCHGQGVRAQPRTLLDAIPRTRRVELSDPEACCGSAGIYSLLRPEDSAAVLAPRLADLEASGASLLVTGNPGCHLQWTIGIRRRGLPVEVLHIAELLQRSLEGGLDQERGSSASSQACAAETPPGKPRSQRR